jgi:hypothetical protein
VTKAAIKRKRGSWREKEKKEESKIPTAKDTASKRTGKTMSQKKIDYGGLVVKAALVLETVKEQMTHNFNSPRKASFIRIEIGAMKRRHGFLGGIFYS